MRRIGHQRESSCLVPRRRYRRGAFTSFHSSTSNQESAIGACLAPCAGCDLVLVRIQSLLIENDVLNPSRMRLPVSLLLPLPLQKDEVNVLLIALAQLLS